MEPRFTLTFDDESTAQVLQVQPEQDLTVAVSAINLSETRPVLVIIGGASQISEADLQRLEHLFVEVLAPFIARIRLICRRWRNGCGGDAFNGQCQKPDPRNFSSNWSFA